ncbi:MAG: hypothetical protein U0R28_11210 [Candidatus Nanopelagicales bacterium]
MTARLKGAAATTLAIAVAVIGVSQAATLGTVSGRSLAAGTVSNPVLCSAGSIGVTTQVGYSSSRYEIYQLTFSGIPAGCQGKSFIAQFADSTTNASLGMVTGTLPAAASGTAAVPAGTNPNLNSVSSTLKVVLYVSG